MSTAAISPGPDTARTLAQHIDRFLARQPLSAIGERRESERVAIPLLIRVMPLGVEIDDEEPLVTAVGKDLSRSGVGIYHREPLPHRRVVLTFEDNQHEQLCVEVELNRCRFSDLGWYESGGRLVRVLEPAG